MTLARRRMLATSCRTELGQIWRRRMLVEGAGAVRWGNIVIVVSIASPRMFWMWLARSRIWAVVVCDISLYPCGEISYGEVSRESRSERAWPLRLWWRSVSLPPLGLSIPRDNDMGLGIGTWALEVVVCPGGLYPLRLRLGCVAGLGPSGGLGMMRGLSVYR